MDWIILNLITNKRNNNWIYGILVSIIILDFLNDQMQFFPPQYLILDFSLCAIGLLIIKEIANYWYKNLYHKNIQSLNTIRQLVRTENYAQIFDIAPTIKIIKPHLAEKTFWLGVANVYIRQPKETLRLFHAIESEYQNSSDFFYHKGLALLDTKNTTEAVTCFTRAIAIEKTWQSFDQRAIAYLQLNKLEEAENDLQESIALKENSTNTCNMGALLAQKGLHNKAIEFYNRSITINPENKNAFFNRGLSQQKMANLKSAINDFKKAEQLDCKKANRFLKNIK